MVSIALVEAHRLTLWGHHSVHACSPLPQRCSFCRSCVVRGVSGVLRCLPVQAGKGSATLSMAYAAAKFAESCVLALQGQPVVECAYVESHLTDLPFFASQVRLGPNGIEVRCFMDYQSARVTIAEQGVQI